MGVLRPFLTNGRQSDQNVLEVSQSSTGVRSGGLHIVGTRASLPDGRVYYYARSSGIAIEAGQLLQMPDIPATWTDLATQTEVIGTETIRVTNGAVTALANAFAGGYIVVQDDTGEGQVLQVKSHPVWGSAAEVAVTITEPLVVSFGANTTVSMVMSPWADVVISGVNQDHMAVGVSNVRVPAGTTNPNHFWCQTWGVAGVWQDDTTANGSKLTSGSTAGQVEISGADGDQDIGQLLVVAGAVADYTPTFLTIAP